MSGAGVHAGAPPKEWQGWDSQLVHFHNFESLSTGEGHSVYSQKFSCCNHEWKLKLCPGGTNFPMALFLLLSSGTDFSATFNIIIRDAHGRNFRNGGYTQGTLTRKFEKGRGRGYRWSSSSLYEEIIDPSNEVLSHGTLTVEVQIKPGDQEHCCTNFIPKNEFTQNMTKSFMHKDSADVIFEVGGQTESDPKVQFYAHKLVLHFCAKGSHMALLGNTYKKSTPVPITDVDPHIFHQMLFYVYGGNIPAKEWREKSKDYIDAADRYGVKNLKIEAEAWYAKYCEITLDNVIDELLYADEKNCFLMKELAMQFIMKNAKEVLETKSFEKIPESKDITREIFTLIAMNNQAREGGNLQDPTRLSINELRARVYARGKDIDSPRKTLIEHLQPKNKKLKVSQDEQPTNEE